MSAHLGLPSQREGPGRNRPTLPLSIRSRPCPCRPAPRGLWVPRKVGLAKIKRLVSVCIWVNKHKRGSLSCRLCRASRQPGRAEVPWVALPFLFRAGSSGGEPWWLLGPGLRAQSETTVRLSTGQGLSTPRSPRDALLDIPSPVAAVRVPRQGADQHCHKWKHSFAPWQFSGIPQCRFQR